jgi:hypothetical protein
MINVTFVYNGTINGYPSWIGYDGTTLLTILWTGTYWVMYGWPYDGEPRNYNNTLNPTTGWALYDNTTLTATFNVVLGACPIPTPTPTPTGVTGCTTWNLTAPTDQPYDISWVEYYDCSLIFQTRIILYGEDPIDFCVDNTLGILNSVINNGSELTNTLAPCGLVPTPSPTVTPGITITPTPSITPSQICSAPVLNNVTLVSRHLSEYTFGLFFTSLPNCNDVIYEYSCDGISWTSCGYDECADGFGCISPVQVTIADVYGCVICSGNWYFRIKQCCPNNLQSNYSNTITFVPVSTSPSITPTVTRTPSRTPSVTPTISITPTRTITPTTTQTPTPSVTPGLCRFLDSLSCNVERGNYVRIQYTNCAGALKIFNVYLPTGINVVDVSSLNICMKVGTPLTIITGAALSIQPIFGDSCTVVASPSPTPTPTVTPSKTPSITPSITPTPTSPLIPVNSVEWFGDEYVAYSTGGGGGGEYTVVLNGTVEIIGDPVTFKAYGFWSFLGPSDGSVLTSVSIGAQGRYAEAIFPNILSESPPPDLILPANTYVWQVIVRFFDDATEAGEGGILWTQ